MLGMLDLKAFAAPACFFVFCLFFSCFFCVFFFFFFFFFPSISNFFSVCATSMIHVIVMILRFEMKIHGCYNLC